MWTALFSAIAAIPGILSYLEKFGAWFTDQINAAKIKQAEAAMAKASDQAKQTKDTSGLDQAFDPDKGKT